MNETENSTARTERTKRLDSAREVTKIYYTQNHAPCKNGILRMVIGGWTDYYVNHSDNWVAFNVHGERVNVYNDKLDGDTITFQWAFNTLRTTVGQVIKAMSLIDKWLEV